MVGIMSQQNKKTHPGLYSFPCLQNNNIATFHVLPDSSVCKTDFDRLQKPQNKAMRNTPKGNRHTKQNNVWSILKVVLYDV